VEVDPTGSIELVTGPARSGKSLWAEQRALASARRVHYLATGPQLPDDQAWQERLRRHRQRRPASWTCREVGLELTGALADYGPEDVVLIDSLGTWIARGLEQPDADWEQSCGTLLTALQRCNALVVLVSEQVGWGVVPATAIGGLFRDRLGQLEQAITPLCSRLWLVIAGRALDLLPGSHPVARCHD
jgi:adenosylcobinamide kinase/adenosylcobinamide-phosphate guanylyltransferase